MPLDYLGIEDNTLPITPKPSLQQYDNYQIYTLVCIDRIYQTISTDYYTLTPVSLTQLAQPYTTTTIHVNEQNDWVAIQSFSIHGKPKTDFLNYVNQYHE